MWAIFGQSSPSGFRQHCLSNGQSPPNFKSWNGFEQRTIAPRSQRKKGLPWGQLRSRNPSPRNRNKLRSRNPSCHPWNLTVEVAKQKDIRMMRVCNVVHYFFFVETGRVEPNRLQNGAAFFFNLVRVCNWFGPGRLQSGSV